MIDNRKLIVLLLLLAPTSATNRNSTIDGVANVCSYTEHVNVTFLSVNVIACNDNEGT